MKINDINIKEPKRSHIQHQNRIIINFSNISKDVIKKAEEIRGPSVNSKPEAIEGFLKSQNIKKSQINSKSTEKGEFYFYKKT